MLNKPLRLAFLVVDDRFGRPLPRPSFGAAPTALLQGFKELGQDWIHVHVISCVEHCLPAPEKLEENIWYHQIVLPHWRFLRTLHSGPVMRIRKLLKLIQPDIVHSQGTERWCAVSGALSGFPAVLTIHGHLKLILKVSRMRPNFYWKLQMLLGEFAIPRHMGVVCISRHVEHSVHKQAKQHWLIPNAVRQPFFAPAENTASSKPRLLVIGTITENKQQCEILDCFKRIHNRGLDFEAMFIGDNGNFGKYQTQFGTEIVSAEKAGFARFLGRLEIDELITLMDSSHALVHFPKEEAFGLVVAESLARGLMLFASSVGGIRDIAGGIDGVKLFSVNDFCQLEETIISWIQSGAVKLPNACPVISRLYAPASIAVQHCDVYEKHTQLT
ncbi:MAG: glycosyltransferase [bacterium]